MPRWFACLCRWARLHAIAEYRRDKLQQIFVPERVKAAIQQRRVNNEQRLDDGTQRQRVETLEPRLLFSSTLGGSVFGDTDLDGLRGADDVGLSGWAVYIDENLNGVRDRKEPATETDREGRYTISGLDAGTHDVRVDVPAGWEAGGLGGESQTILLDGKRSFTELNFSVNPELDITALLTDKEAAEELSRNKLTRLETDTRWDYVYKANDLSSSPDSKTSSALLRDNTLKPAPDAEFKVERGEVRLEAVIDGVTYSAPLRSAYSPLDFGNRPSNTIVESKRVADDPTLRLSDSSLGSSEVTEPDALPDFPFGVAKFAALTFSDLASYWSFDEHEGDILYDLSPNSNDIFVDGNINWEHTSQRGGGINFNGTDEFLSAGNNFSFNFTKNYTLAGWIKPDSVTGTRGILTKLTDYSDKQYALSIDDGELRLDAENNGNDWTLKGGTISTGTWQHVAVTVTDTLVTKLFINGQVVATSTMPTEVDASTAPLEIGRWGGVYESNYFDGVLDDIRLYNVAASDADVLALYNESPATVTVSASASPATEQGASQDFIFTRDTTAGALTVDYRYTASAGASDFNDSVLTGSVTIPDGQNTATITITPTDDSFSEGTEFIRLIVEPSADYAVGQDNVAFVQIVDDEPSITAIADTYVTGGSLADTNFGDEAEVRINANSVNQLYQRESYFTFDVSSLANAGDVTFRVIPTVLATPAKTETVQIHLVDPSWSEYKLTFNTAPTLGTSLGTVTNLDVYQPIEVTIPAAEITNAINNHAGELSIVMRQTGSSEGLDLGSRENPEAMFHPVLVDQIGVPQLDISLVSDTINASTRTVEVRVEVTDALADDLGFSINWGDGTVTNHTPNPGDAFIQATHVFNTAADYEIRAIATGFEGRRLDGSPSYPSAIESPDLVGLWRFNEGAHEAGSGAVNSAATGSGPDGTYVKSLKDGVLRYPRLGHPGWLFDGSETAPDFSPGYVQLQDDPAFDLAEGTISFFLRDANVIRNTGLFSKDGVILGNYNNEGDLTISTVPRTGTQDTEGAIQVRLTDASGLVHTLSSADSNVWINAGQWHQVSFSWGPSGMKLYIDGELIRTNAAVITGIQANNHPVVIAASQENGTVEDFTSGYIDEFSIFSKQLSDQELMDQFFAESVTLTPASQIVHLVEDDRLITDNFFVTGMHADFMVPQGADHIKIDLRNITFDTVSEDDVIDEINDGLEFAFLHADTGQSIFTDSIGVGRDAAFNLTTRGGYAAIPNVGISDIVDGNNYSLMFDIGSLVNTGDLNVGDQIRLVARLINNDSDNTASVDVDFRLDDPNQGIYFAGFDVPDVSAPPDQRPFLAAEPVAYADLEDVSNEFEVTYLLTSYNDEAQELSVGLNVRKTGSLGVRDRLLLAVSGFDQPGVVWLNSDGQTPEILGTADAGTQYLDVTHLLETDDDGFFTNGTFSHHITLRFSHVNNERFDYNLAFLGEVNRTPEFTTTQPTDRVRVGNTFTYNSSAIDPNGDGVVYGILQEDGSSGNTLTIASVQGQSGVVRDTVVSIDPDTGSISWDTSGSDVQGSSGIDVSFLNTDYEFTIVATDPYGLAATQPVLLTVFDEPGNLPPEFQTTEITFAYAGVPYIYDSEADDPEDDALTYGFDATLTEADDLFGSNFAVDPGTGEVTWTPGAIQEAWSGSATGISAKDGYVGTGYLMYSAERVQDRFGATGSQHEHFVPVRVEDGQWKFFTDGAPTTGFTPRPTDLLVARVDFNGETSANPGVNVVHDLKGTEGRVEGIASGYADGDLTYVAGAYNGNSNPGEFNILGTAFTRNLGPTLAPINTASQYSGVASKDGYVGTGYMMYSAESVHDRFAGAVISSNADHYLTVIYQNDQWSYFNNETLLPFTPRPTDILVASVEFNGETTANPDVNTIQDLQGTEGTVHGIASGYAEGNLVFVASQYNGGSSQGEFDVLGDTFTPNFSSIIGQDFGVVLTVNDGQGGSGEQDYTITILEDPTNNAPVFTKLPAKHYFLPGESNPADGDVSPDSIDLRLGPADGVVPQTVSLTLPTNEALLDKVDVFLLFDDTGSFGGYTDSIGQIFSNPNPGTGEELGILETLANDLDLASVDFGFGVGRFEDYSLGGASFNENNLLDRPFILNQPVISVDVTDFNQAIEAALSSSRASIGNGGDLDEALVEALYQLATGEGFDGAGLGGDISGSGILGDLPTQTNSTNQLTGDVPAFDPLPYDSVNNLDGFLANPTGLGDDLVLAPEGTLGGAGFREGALPIVLIATDALSRYQPEDNPNTVNIIGVDNVTIPLDDFTGTGSASTDTPGGLGAQIQETVTALNSLGALVIGFSPNSFGDVRTMLESFATATGAVNESGSPVDPGTPLDPTDDIPDGSPFFFDLNTATSSGTVIADIIKSAVTDVVFDIDLVPSDGLDPSFLGAAAIGNVDDIGPGETVQFDVSFQGDGAAHSYDLRFVRKGTNVELGRIPVRINASYVSDADAYDPDGDLVTYSFVDSTGSSVLELNGATINPVTGEVDWSPTMAGDYDFVIRASDGKGGVTDEYYTVTVDDLNSTNSPPLVSSTAPPDAVVGQGYVYQVEAIDPDNDPLSYFLQSDAPEGVDIDSDGLLRWTPMANQVGPTSFTVLVSDGRADGLTSHNVVIEVSSEPSENNDPVILSRGPKAAIEGTPYLYTVAGYDSDGDELTYELLSKPDGMGISPTGDVVWIPGEDQVGASNTAVVLVTDGRGGAAYETLDIEVSALNDAPEFVTEFLPPVTAGDVVSIQIDAFDPNGDELSYYLDWQSVLRGMDIDGNGLLTWNSPNALVAGDYQIYIRIYDGRDGVVDRPYTLKITDNAFPEFNDPLPATVHTIGSLYAQELDVTDVEDDAAQIPVQLTLSQYAKDLGVTFDYDNPINGNPALSWNPVIGGDYTIEVTAEDSFGNQSVLTVPLLVVEPNVPNDAPTIDTPARGPAVVGRQWSYLVQTSDKNGDLVTFVTPPTMIDADGQPITDLTWTDSGNGEGLLQWTPPEGTKGPAEVSITISDSKVQVPYSFLLPIYENAPSGSDAARCV